MSAAKISWPGAGLVSQRGPHAALTSPERRSGRSGNWNVKSRSGHVSDLVVSSFVAIPCRLKDNQDVNEGVIYRASRELLGRNSKLI
jgi:hypothetical protein